MLIGKVGAERKEANRKDNKDHKKLLKEILSCLNNLEASTKWLAKDQRDQKEKMEWVAAQFHLYLWYVHHMDITPVDGNGAPNRIRKTRTIVQKEENKDREDEGKKHIIILD